MRALVDYAADLPILSELIGGEADVDAVLGRALDALEAVLPYDLAAILQLRGDELVTRVARGPLALAAVQRHRLKLSSLPSLQAALLGRRPLALGAHHHSDEGDPWDGVLDLPHGHSCMVVPLFSAERDLGVITLDRSMCAPYEAPMVELAAVYGQLISLAMVYAEQAELLDRYRQQLEERNRLMATELSGSSEASSRLARSKSPAMARLVRQARQVASTDTPVLILGETGAGKEVLAQAIHETSARRGRAFVKLNCAAIPEGLMESELFGHVEGAFSGATSTRPGRFLTANGGTLLLDEIGDLPLGAQAKLLRVLQEGTFEPVGSDQTVRVDVRLLAATHVDLARAVAEGRFREDLLYRLDVFPLHMPPLRARLEDVPELCQDILAQLRERTGRGPWALDSAAQRWLQEQSWPGNVRQLVNSLERATILVPAGVIGLAALQGGFTRQVGEGAPRSGGGTEHEVLTLSEMERRYIEQVLEQVQGRIYGEGGAAELLGMPPTTLQSRMKRLGVRRG